MDEAGISTPRAVWERNNRGRALFELGRLEDAMHYYGEAVEICLEWNYSDTLPLSIEYFNEVLKIDPRNVEALVAKAATLGKLKRFREALKCYDLALSIDLNHAGAWAGKGACLVALGKPGEGKICLQRAFKLDPNLKERGEKISKTDIVQINIHRFFGEYAYELSKKPYPWLSWVDWMKALQYLSKQYSFTPTMQ